MQWPPSRLDSAHIFLGDLKTFQVHTKFRPCPGTLKLQLRCKNRVGKLCNVPWHCVLGHRHRRTSQRGNFCSSRFLRSRNRIRQGSSSTPTQSTFGLEDVPISQQDRDPNTRPARTPRRTCFQRCPLHRSQSTLFARVGLRMYRRGILRTHHPSSFGP